MRTIIIQLLLSGLFIFSGCKEKCVTYLFKEIHTNPNFAYVNCKNKGGMQVSVFELKSSINNDVFKLGLSLKSDTFFIEDLNFFMPLFCKSQVKDDTNDYFFTKDQKKFKIINKVIDVKYLNTDTIYTILSMCHKMSNISYEQEVDSSSSNLRNENLPYWGLYLSRMPFSIIKISLNKGVLLCLYNKHAIGMNPMLNSKIR
jgi:hypothetical protein